MSIERGDTVTKEGKVGTVVAASDNGVVVRWNGDITLEQAGDLAPAPAPVPVGLPEELRAELYSWKVPD